MHSSSLLQTHLFQTPPCLPGAGGFPTPREERQNPEPHPFSFQTSPSILALTSSTFIFFLTLHYHNTAVSVSFPTGHILEEVALPAIARSPSCFGKPDSPCMLSACHFPVSLRQVLKRPLFLPLHCNRFVKTSHFLVPI